MRKFRVYANGFDMGVFEAEDERGALEALAQDAGYEGMDDMNERLESDPASDDYEVVEEENKMRKFKVFANGVKAGIFAAENEDAALEAYAQKEGYQSLADMDEQLGSEAEYDVVEEENKMRKFKVFANGVNMGIFAGEDETAALEAYAQEAGYQRLADMNEQLGSVPEYKIVEEENKMRKFRVYANGFDMGVFEAEDERGALEALAQDAGYESMDDMNERLESDSKDEYDVVEEEK